MARCVLGLRVMCLCVSGWAAVPAVPAVVAVGSAVGSASCVIPPPLEIGERDAGTNFTPRILSAGPAPDFSFPGPITLDRGDERRLTVSLEDPDLDDTLFVRLYVDYEFEGGAPTPSLGTCSAPPSGELGRIADCSTATLCTTIDNGDTERHLLEIVVADREFLQEGDPLFRPLPAGARSTVRSWLMTCRDATPM